MLAANRRVGDLASRYTGLHGMDSTIVAIAIQGVEAAVAHMGNSRAYLLRHAHSIP